MGLILGEGISGQRLAFVGLSFEVYGSGCRVQGLGGGV